MPLCCEDGLVSRVRRSGKLVTLIVCISLLTDNMLLTLVDPILPDIMRQIEGYDFNTTELASDIINANGRYGYLVSAKGAAQFFFNPFVGLIVTRFGYRRPLLVGSITLMVSTAAFAFGNTYVFLFGARVVQGVSSSVSAVAGLGLLAASYTDDEERGKAMGLAFGGLSIGIILGPVYGSILYQLWGQAVPFLALSAVVLFEISLQVFAYQKEDNTNKDHSLKSICRLIIDPYIFIVIVNIFLVNLDVSLVLAFLPVQLMDLHNPPTWQLGIVVLPTSVGYLFASATFPRLIKWLKRWLCGGLGLFLSAASLIALSFCDTFLTMCIATTFLGISIGMVSTSMQPMLAHIVDLRHSSLYGNVYAISDMAVCLSMFIGPLIGGPIVYSVGFRWLCIGCGVINVGFTLFSFMLRNPPPAPLKLGLMKEDEDEVDEHSYLISYSSVSSGKTSVRTSTCTCTSMSSRSRSKLAVNSIRHIPTARTLDYISPIEGALSDVETESVVYNGYISSL